MGATLPRVTRFHEAGNLIAKIVNVKTRDFLQDTWIDLVNATPVKSGKARASWKISPGSPFTKELPRGVYPYPEHQDLRKYTRNWTKWYIANTASYIEKLNAGSSKQAPAGFVQAAIQRNIIRYG